MDANSEFEFLVRSMPDLKSLNGLQKMQCHVSNLNYVLMTIPDW